MPPKSDSVLRGLYNCLLLFLMACARTCVCACGFSMGDVMLRAAPVTARLALSAERLRRVGDTNLGFP